MSFLSIYEKPPERKDAGRHADGGRTFADAVSLFVGDYFFNVFVRTRYHVNAYEFADFLGGGGSGFHGGANGSDLSSDHRGDQSGADLFISDETDFGGFDHGIRGLNHSDEPSGFNHTQRFFDFRHFYDLHGG
jgi:hypothetical protein